MLRRVRFEQCPHCGIVLANLTQEKLIWEGQPSHLYYLGYYILGTLLIIVWFLGLLLIIYAILRQRTTKFTVTNRRITFKEGIVAKNIREVTIKDIRNINFKQNIFERIFGLGSIEIGTAGTGGIEVEFYGIIQPQRVKNMISKLKDNLM